MPAKRRRPAPVIQWMHTYLFRRADEKAAKAKKKVVGDDLREYVRDHGIVRADENGNEITGNIEYRLSEPIEVEGEKYYGMELRKQQPITFDWMAAIELAKKLGWKEEEYGEYVFEIHQDAFYVANQMGLITDDQLDALLVDGEPNYSLWPLEMPE